MEGRNQDKNPVYVSELQGPELVAMLKDKEYIKAKVPSTPVKSKSSASSRIERSHAESSISSTPLVAGEATLSYDISQDSAEQGPKGQS